MCIFSSKYPAPTREEKSGSESVDSTCRFPHTHTFPAPTAPAEHNDNKQSRATVAPSNQPRTAKGFIYTHQHIFLLLVLRPEIHDHDVTYDETGDRWALAR